MAHHNGRVGTPAQPVQVQLHAHHKQVQANANLAEELEGRERIRREYYLVPIGHGRAENGRPQHDSRRHFADHSRLLEAPKDGSHCPRGQHDHDQLQKQPGQRLLQMVGQTGAEGKSRSPGLRAATAGEVGVSEILVSGFRGDRCRPSLESAVDGTTDNGDDPGVE